MPALVAVYLPQLPGHIAIATPKYAVATHDDRTEADATAVGESGQGLFVDVDDGQYLVAAYPHLTVVTILGFHLDATDGHVQTGWQVGNGVARLDGGCASGLAMNIPQPKAAMGVLADFGHQREVGYFFPIGHRVHRIAVDSVGFAGIDFVAVGQ